MRSLLLAALVASTVTISGPVVADGKRWAAWTPHSGLAVVYDDRTGRRRRVAVPDCPLAGVTAGTLLVQCPNTERPYAPDPVLVDVATGTLTNVGGPGLGPDTLVVPPYRPMAYSGRRALEFVPGRGGRLRLWRCGVDRPRRLKNCSCHDVNLAAGLATWADTRARALDIASGKRRAWKFPGGDGHVAQAGRTVLLGTTPATISDPPGKLRIVRWR
jgi:hypothetical protein